MAYAVLFAALLVPLGRLADRYGRKAGFLGGLAVFTVASAACAVSPNLWSLVAFRGLQAVGAAALTPTSLGLLLAATPDDRKVKAVRIWAAIGALAAAFGPVVGGLLVQLDWRWVFVVNLPIGIGALIAGQRMITRTRMTCRSSESRSARCRVQSRSASGALALGMVKGPDWGWSSARCGRISLRLQFSRSQRSGGAPAATTLPVIELSLLRVRTFAWSNVTAVLFNVAVWRVPARDGALAAGRLALLGNPDGVGSRPRSADGADLHRGGPSGSLRRFLQGAWLPSAAPCSAAGVLVASLSVGSAPQLRRRDPARMADRRRGALASRSPRS